MNVHKGTPAVRSSLFGGRGDVRVFNLLQSLAPPFTAVLSCELAPNGIVGAHVQEAYPEVVIGLEGDGVAIVDDHSHALGAGDVVFLPLGAVLRLENQSSEAWLRYLIIKAQG